ncbi:MAG TPA: class I tRNA ligase family protein, partial [Chitinophagales bacterium]|nr:class I tRNA ligase family protein [Chitinophagales bacterium]
LFDYELTTMPGWAGSSWYFFRYMDPQNTKQFASDKTLHYWKDVDFYLGGSEHATGHLLYFRFWTKVLYDLGLVPTDEPVRKLVNQGMIQGVSSLVPRLKGTDQFVSADILETHMRESNLSYDDVQWLYADVSLVDNGMLNMQGFREWNPEYAEADFVTNSANAVIVKQQVEKMSKRWFNVVNPDDVVAKYGADGFRMYEMFLGPIEMSKPWDTKGIDGVARFLRKFWRLFYNDHNEWTVNDDEPTKDQLKALHRVIKKVSDDLERLSFNTAVSAFMIAVNELSQLNARSKKILEPLLVLMHPLAPFITEYLWLKSGHNHSILTAKFPTADESLLVENAFEYPVSVNGKVRTKLVLPLELTQPDVEKEVLALDVVQKWMEGKTAKKVVFVKGRMINVVV